MGRNFRLGILGCLLAAGGAACGSSAQRVSLGEIGGGGAGGTAETTHGGPGVSLGSGAAGKLGVTPGGAKDIGYARMLIGSGQVPEGKAITVEGLLSEHDIPVEGAECGSLLCVRPALGVAMALDTGAREHFIQLGFASGFQRATFKRPPLDLVVAVDHSSSMSGDQRETNAAVASLVDKMRDDDRLAVIVFNDTVTAIHKFGPVIDKKTLKTVVAGVRAEGGWNFDGALKSAYEILRGTDNDPRRLRRVMLFSCGYPAVSADGRDAASRLITAGAAERIGLSFFGVLLGWDPALADLLGRVRGGSFHYLQDLAKVEQVFDADFDFMVTPVLYDLKISVHPGARFEVVKLYGMPGMSAEEMVPATGPPTPLPNAGEAQTGGAFLSSRKGAIVARLRLKAGEARGDIVGSVKLVYEPESALGRGTGVVEEIVPVADAQTSEQNDDVFQGIGVHKSVVLTNQALRMRAACDSYHAGNREQATEIGMTLLDYLRNEAVGFGDDLAGEVKLVQQLVANIGK